MWERYKSESPSLREHKNANRKNTLEGGAERYFDQGNSVPSLASYAASWASGHYRCSLWPKRPLLTCRIECSRGILSGNIPEQEGMVTIGLVSSFTLCSYLGNCMPD